jgi:hypothetical protein
MESKQPGGANRSTGEDHDVGLPGRCHEIDFDKSLYRREDVVQDRKCRTLKFSISGCE